MEEQPPIWRVVANILNKQSRRVNTGWSSSLGNVRDTNNFSAKTLALLQNGYVYLRLGLIHWFSLAQNRNKWKAFAYAVINTLRTGDADLRFLHGEARYICKFSLVPLHKGECFQRYHTLKHY